MRKVITPPVKTNRRCFLYYLILQKNQFYNSLLPGFKGQSPFLKGGMKIFVTGISSGGFMANTLGCLHGNVIRAIAPVAGAGLYTCCTGKVVVMQIHGRRDMLVL